MTLPSDMVLARVAAIDGGVAPSAAVTMSDAKRHINVYHADDDALISALIAAAQSHLEGPEGCGGTLGRAVSRHVLEMRLPRFPVGRRLFMPQPPLIAVGSVAYIAPNGISDVMDPAHYHVVPRHLDPHIMLRDTASWPSTIVAPDAVTVRFTVGPLACPQDLQQAMLLHIGHMYLHREAVGESAAVLPFAYKALCDPHRTHGWI